MDVDNPIHKATKWIMEQLLQEFLFRLFVNVLVLAGVVYYLHTRCHLLGADKANYYQNVWIYAAYIPSFLVTGIIFWYVFVESSSRDAGELITAMFAAALGSLFLFALLFSPLVLGMDRDPIIYHVFALLICILVFIIDLLLMRSGQFDHMDTRWESVKTFDLGIIFGTIAILVIGRLIKDCAGELVSAGFTGGGVAFQLLMSNLLFDPELYKLTN